MIEAIPDGPDWVLELAETERGLAVQAPPRVQRDPMSAIERMRYFDNRRHAQLAKANRSRRAR
jgi:hypothetical protein